MVFLTVLDKHGRPKMMGLKSELEKLCRGTAVVCCFLSTGTAHERTHDEMGKLQSLLS